MNQTVLRRIVLFLASSLLVGLGSGFCQSDLGQIRFQEMSRRMKQSLHAGNIVLAEERMDSMIVLAKEENNQENLLFALDAKNQMHLFRSEFDLAIPLLKQQIRTRRYLKTNPGVLALTTMQLGEVFKSKGELDSALHYSTISLGILPNVPDSLGYRINSYVYNSHAVMHYAAGNLDSAAFYHEKQLEYVRPLDTTRFAGTYFNLAQVLMDMNNYQEAHNYADRILKLTNADGFQSQYARAHRVKAKIFIKDRKFNIAEKYAMKAVELYDNTNFKTSANSIYLTYSKALLLNNKIKEAKENIKRITNPELERNLENKANYYLTLLDIELRSGSESRIEEAYQLAKDVVVNLDQINPRQTFHDFSAIYHELNGRYKDAYSDLKVSRMLRDSALSRENQIIVNALQAKYESSLKEKRIAEQKLELNKVNSRQQILWISLIGLLFLAGSIFWFLRKQSRISSELKESEILSLRKENKLIAMQSILSGQEEERKRIAQDLHDSIGTLMGTIKMKVFDIQQRIENVQQINIAGEIDTMVGKAATEIRRISHNMTPIALDLTGLEGAIEDLGTQLRMNGIDCTFSLAGLDHIEDKQKQVVIFRVLQEIVNNIGRHSQARNAYVNSFIDDDILRIEIGDDGVGMSETAWVQSTGLGINSIKSRVEYLDGQIQMNSDKGTSFVINIPI